MQKNMETIIMGITGVVMWCRYNYWLGPPDPPSKVKCRVRSSVEDPINTVVTGDTRKVASRLS